MRNHLTEYLQILLASAAVVAASACGPRADSSDGTATPALSNAALAGSVKMDGSGTVLPVSRLVTDAFLKDHSGVHVSLENSGTGGGFKKFCAGQTDINDASRPINQAESQTCDANKIEYVELPFAFDAISVVTSAKNTFLQCLTVDELKRIWEPAAQGKVTRWNQIRSSFPDQPVALFGPGNASGTFDYFTLAVVGKESSSRSDYTKAEDEGVSNDLNLLAEGVANDPNTLGYFGYSYYIAHKGTLKLVSIDGGSGCVAPSATTIAENQYQPLTRPIFIYVSKASLRRPEVNALAQFYMAPENARFSLEAGYLPLPAVTLLTVGRRLDQGLTGSVFGGHGSVVGVTVDSFQDDDKISSALVQ